MSAQGGAISPLLDGLACELIGVCLDDLAAGEDIWPMLAYTSAPGAEVYLTFDDDTYEGCLEAARDQVGKLPGEVRAYALAYEGFVQLEDDGASTDALLVEFGERGATTAYSAYVPYRRGRSEEEFVSGEPLAAGEEPLLFAEGPASVAEGPSVIF